MKLTRKVLRKLILKEFNATNLGREFIFNTPPPPKEPMPKGGGGEEFPCEDTGTEKYQNSERIVRKVFMSYFPNEIDIYNFLESGGVAIDYDYHGPGAGDMIRNMVTGLAMDLCIGPYKYGSNGIRGISMEELISIINDANLLKSYIDDEFLL